MRFLDLSITIDNDVVGDPPLARPKIEYVDHTQTFDRIRSFFPDLVPSDLPDSQAWAIENVALTTHNGTHLDAPYHFHPTMNHALRPGGEPASTIDEIPLDWCFRPGVKLDFRHFEDGYVATVEDVRNELARINWKLSPLDIVLINTRAGERYGHGDYVEAGCGIGREATLMLLEAGVKITGTDAWSWDAPFGHTAEKVRQTGNKALIWEGHKAGREYQYCHLEKLHRLEQLPPSGFTVACFPVSIRRASAGWTRAVAIFDD
ncbi:MAG: cyclase family protein [Nitratireductor sp.]|nr:cyclase family protein [Nitratireductor sp.]